MSVCIDLNLISSLFIYKLESVIIMAICDTSGALTELGVYRLPVPSPENFSRNLAVLLDRAGYTKSEFARVMGVTPSTVTLWLNSKTSPRLKDLDRIAAHFAVRPGDLIAADFTPAAGKIEHISPQEALRIIQEHLEKQAKKKPKPD